MPPARSVMSRDLLVVEPSLPLSGAAERMAARNVGAVLVNEGGRVVGILTERDILRAVARGLKEDTLVGHCMTRDPESIDPDDSTEHAAVLMIHGGFRHVPVMEGDEIVGMLSIRDLMSLALEDSAPRGA